MICCRSHSSSPGVFLHSPFLCAESLTLWMYYLLSEPEAQSHPPPNPISFPQGSLSFPCTQTDDIQLSMPLPPYCHEFVSLFCPWIESSWSALRMGLSRGLSSFLNCILSLNMRDGCFMTVWMLVVLCDGCGCVPEVSPGSFVERVLS